MKRRKFLLGTGAAAAGGASLLGSGAFTSVSAERTIAVDVAGDADAFLRLAPCTIDDEEQPNGAYVHGHSDGTISIDLSESNPNEVDGESLGDGVNADALSKFHNVFEICNQGTQPVCVDFAVDVPVIPNGADVPDRYDFDDGDLAVVFYRRDGDESDDLINVDDLDPNRSRAFSLDVGECQCVGFNVRAFGFETEEDLFADAKLEIIAEAGAECADDPPEEQPGEPGEDLELTYADRVVDDETKQGKEKDGSNIDSSRTDPQNAIGTPDGDFFSLGFRPAGADWDWDDGGGRLVVEFDDELVRRAYDTDVLDIETTNGRGDYPEERALVEVAGPGTDGEYEEIGTASNKASGGQNTFELPAEPITKVRITDQTDRNQDWDDSGPDGFDVAAVGGYKIKD